MLVKKLVKGVRTTTQWESTARSREMWSVLEEEPAKGFEPLAYGLRTHYRAFASFR
jgi:hypothetical protein